MKKGQSIIELMFAIGIMAVLLPVLVVGFTSSREGRAQQKQRLLASSYMKETEEGVRSVREKGWTQFAVNGSYHLQIIGSSWSLGVGSTTVNGFTQQIIISDVSRDSNGIIVASGGTVDPSTKKVNIIISWSLPIVSSINSTMYLSRYLENISVVKTTVSDFNTGTMSGTQVTNTSGGEVILANSNYAKWCSPALSSATIDLPDGPPVAVAAMANQTSTSIPNDVFVAVAPSTSTPIKMAYLTVSANTDPPVPTLKGTFTLDAGKYSAGTYPTSLGGLSNDFKTNDVKYYKSPSGKTYALLATNLSDHEVIAILVKDENGNDVYQDPNNKIYKYQTFFNTKIYGSPVSPTSTPTATPVPTPIVTVTPPGPITSSVLYPSGNGNYTAWTGDYTDVDETGTASCSSNDSVISSTNNQRESFTINLSSIPNGSTITSVDVTAGDRGDSSAGGTYKMFVRFNGVNTDDSVTQTAVGTSGSTCHLHTSTVDVTDTVKGTGTTLEIGVLKTGTTSPASNGVRVGTMKVVITYIPAIVNTPTPTRTPTPIPTPTSIPGASSNDQSPYGYGAVKITVLGDRGYTISGGYLYTFDLSNIDSKSPTSGLDQLGCRIELDGYDCSPGSGTDRKYNAGQTGTSWSNTTSPAHDDCSDGGNVELYADNDIYPVQSSGSTYIFVAVGAGIDPEFNIVNVTNVPSSSTSPAINSNNCGTISNGSSGWKRVSSYDFNSKSGTEEAANSVYANADGSRAYISSNGGIDANHDGNPDSYQLYILDTSSKTSPKFLSGSPSTGATSGYYYGTDANAQLYPRRSLTVLNGRRAILVGRDSIPDSNDAQEYQVVDISTEATPTYCGGINFDQGFNDLTSVSEADGDNFVYMVANTMEKQLKILQGGPDVGIYVSSGIFESSVIDANGSAGFNRFSANVVLPAQTSLTMQIGVAAPVNNSCTNAVYTFIGSDKNDYTGSYFSPVGSVISGIIPMMINQNYSNPNRCFKYKIYLSTLDNMQTPTLQDVTVNYSP